MGIYISNMEMPTEQRVEVLIFKNGFVAYYDVYGHYIGQAKAIPLPEGHGRLIDADEFIERVRMDDRTTIIEEMHIAEILSEAPTIVPADVTDIDVGSKKEGGG